MLIKIIEGDGNLDIQGIEVDSRKVKVGDLFICLSGLSVDGHRFVSQAVANGAVAVLTEKDIDIPSHITKVRVHRVLFCPSFSSMISPLLSMSLLISINFYIESYHTN